MNKYEIGMYVEYQPHNGNQPRGRSLNVRIVEILPDNQYKTSGGKVIHERHILGQNLK